MRIGERALDGVVVALQPCRKLRWSGLEDVDTARVHRRERSLALDQMDRGAALGARFGEKQRRILEIESRERQAARRLLVFREPAQAAGDHEMDDQEQGSLELEDDALAQPTDADELLPLRGGERRSDAAQDERMDQADAREPLPLESGPKLFDVDGDVGELGHRSAIIDGISPAVIPGDTMNFPLSNFLL